MEGHVDTFENLEFVDYALENMLLKEKFLELGRLVGNMLNYPIGDFLIRVKNAGIAGGKEVSFPANNLVVAVAKLLKSEGYFQDVTVLKGQLTANLKIKSKKPLLMDVKLVSKPGLRIYSNVDELKKKKGASIYIVSTPKGVMTDKSAVKAGVGGEVIAEVW